MAREKDSPHFNEASGSSSLQRRLTQRQLSMIEKLRRVFLKVAGNARTS
jgi:hypothetical protein